MGTVTITADMNSTARDTARERQRDLVSFVRAYGVEGEIGLTEHLGRVVISLPPNAAACVSSVREFAKRLLPGAMVDVVARAKPEPRPIIDDLARDLEGVVSRAKTPTTYATTYDLSAYGIKPIPVVTCPDCGTAWPISRAPTTCDGDACVTKRSRARREAQRREIDAVLREDARRFPAFATARRCAVMAAVEAWDDEGPIVSSATAMLGWLREYENLRGAFTKPNASALNHARATFGEDALASYERARGLM